MRVGFVTQLLWHRYGRFWKGLFEEAGAQCQLPDPQETSAYLEDRRVLAVPGLAFRLAVAQALSLEDIDLLVAPSLNWGSESQRGGGQDPWIADFPAALGTVSGLPPVLGVPAWLSREFESLAVEGLQQVARDPGRVRRIWGRHSAALRYQPLPEPRWSAIPAGKRSVGVIAQPWLAGSALAAAAAPDDTVVFGQQQVDPVRLREEGSRVEPRAVPTDQEVLGAARLFSRRGGIRELHMVVDESSGPDLWLRDRVERHAGKPLIVHELHSLLGDEGPLWVLPGGSPK